MKYDFLEGSPERDEIEHRLVLLRLLQGEEIDGAKNGGEKREMPESWTRYDRGLPDMFKKIIADKRPYFTRYLYDSYNKKFREEVDSYNKHCWNRFGKSFDEVLRSETRTQDEERVIKNYYKYSFFLFSNSPMNRICWYMEKEIQSIDEDTRKNSSEFSYEKIYSKSGFTPNEERLRMIEVLFEKYVSAKKALRGVSHTNILRKDINYIIGQTNGDAYEKITSNARELGNLAVYLMANNSRARTFAWDVFGQEIAGNLMERHGRQIDVLVKNYYGDVDFMFEKFSEKRLRV